MKKGLTGSLCCYSHICRGTITSSSVCFHIQTEKLLMWSEPQQHMLVLNNSTERLKRHPAAKNEKYRSNVLTNNCSHFLRHPTTLKNFKTQRKSWSPLSTSSKFSGQNINNYKKNKKKNITWFINLFSYTTTVRKSRRQQPNQNWVFQWYNQNKSACKLNGCKRQEGVCLCIRLCTEQLLKMSL